MGLFRKLWRSEVGQDAPRRVESAVVSGSATASASALIIAAVLLSACAPPVALHTSETDAPDRLESLLEQLTVGTTTRDDAHELMGQPAGASNDGSVEVFRGAEGYDTEAGIMVIFYPIPFVGPGRKTTCYVLLGYDREDIVQQVDSVCASGHDDVQLAAGDYRFEARHSDASLASEGLFFEEALIEPVGTQWPPPPDGQCRVLFVPWAEDKYERQLRIDGKTRTAYGPLSHEGAIQLFLPAGEHRVRISLTKFSWGGGDRLRSTFDCPEGGTIRLADQLRYVWVETEEDKKWWHGDERAVLTGEFEVKGDITAETFELPVISMYHAH